MNLTRRIRGMLKTAGIWAAAWSVPGFIWISILTFRDPYPPFRLLSFVRDILLNWTAVGAISGALFALTLSLAERRQSSLAKLSMRRVTSWGAIGGALLPLVVFPLYSSSLANPLRQLELTVVVYGILGAASAAASLRLARQAPASI